MRRAFVLTAFVATAASCASFTGNGSGAAPDEAVDAGSVRDSATARAAEASAPPEDAGADAALDAASEAAAPPIRVPSGMVYVDAGYAIDETEVTVSAWSTFVNTHTKTGSEINRSEGCIGKTLGPQADCSPNNKTAAPQTCVSWCDAEAFCLAAGKRLCGKIGARSAIANNGDANDRNKDEWIRACVGDGIDTAVWPYGSTSNAQACNTKESNTGDVATVKSFTQCVGGLANLYDMAGNAIEWENACFDDNGMVCLLRGGSWQRLVGDSRCDFQVEADPTFFNDDVGFRCCADPLASH